MPQQQILLIIRIITKYPLRTTLRNIYYFSLLVILFSSCSAKKNTWFSRNMQALNTEFNVYFNAYESYKEGLNIIEKAHTDDYSLLLPMYPISVHSNASAATPQMDRTIEKAEKAIKIHSIRKKPKKDQKRMQDPKFQAFLKQEEYNYRIDEVWLLLGKAQFHKADFLAAVGTFTYTINHFSWDKDCVTEARIWLAKSYIEMDWLYDAEDILIKANKEQISSKFNALYAATSADLLLKNKKYDEAIPLLVIAANNEKDKTQRTRLKYILGQLYRMKNDDGQAKFYFSEVIKANPPTDMEFNARISRAEADTENPQEAIKFLHKMLKNSKYSNYKDKIYFTIGNINQKQKNYEEALKSYQLAIDNSKFNIVNKVQILIAMADLSYNQSKYIEAQPYYKEASSIMPLEHADYQRVNARSLLLEKLNQQYEIVSLQDSLQTLSKLDEKEKEKAIKTLIKTLQKEEEALKEKLLAEAAAENNSFYSNENIPDNSMALGLKTTGDWYFYNNMLKSSGRKDFQSKWGIRQLEDNWRRKNKAVLGFNNDTDEASSFNETASTDNTQENDFINKSLVNTDANFYLKQIPQGDAEIEASNEQIANALYTIGMIYKEDIEDSKKAILTFEELERRFPNEERLADVYYNLYQMNMKANEISLANHYKNQLIQKFPKSSYAIMFSMPDYAERINQLKIKEDSIYQASYFAYLKDDYSTVASNFELIKKEYPLSELLPKFTFLDALSKGKSGQTDAFKNGLQKIISDYPQSDVNSLAKDILALINQGFEAQAGSSHGAILNRRDSIYTTQNQLTDTLSFEKNLKDRHLIVIVAPKDVSLHQLQYDVALYNFTGFMIKEFDLEIKKMISSNLFLISSLDGYEEALWYKEGLLKDKQVDNFMKFNNCSSFIISSTNFELIKKGHTIEEYTSFYKNNIATLKSETVFQSAPTIYSQIPDSIKTAITSTPITLKDTVQTNTVKIATQTPSISSTPTNNTQQTNVKTTIPPASTLQKTKTEIAEKPKNKALAVQPTKKDSVNVSSHKTTVVEPTKNVKTDKITTKTLANTKTTAPVKVEAPKTEVEKPRVELITATKNNASAQKSTATYSYNAMETHAYGIIILEGSFDFISFKSAMDKYNTTRSPLANYKVTLHNVGGQKIITVDGFPTANAARNYLFQTIRQRELFETIKNTEYRNVIISKSNLEKLIKAQNTTDYLDFNRNSNLQK